MANQEHVEILKQGVEVWNEWRKSQATILGLENISLVGINLSGANFKDCILKNCVFKSCDLSNSDFSHARLTECSFMHLSADKSSFLDAGFKSCWFKNVKAKYADLYGAEIDKTTFSSCDCSGSQFMSIHMNDSKINGGNFDGVNMFEVTLDNVRVDGCSLIKADFQFSRCQFIDCRNSDMRMVKFDNSYFKDSLFLGVTMRKGSLNGSDLSRSKLLGVDLTSSDLRRCNLEMTELSGVKFSKSTLQNSFQGIRVSSSFGQDRFKKYASDQSYVEELRNSGKTGEWIFWLWYIMSNCGRSFWPWACWSAAFALSFAAIFFYGLGPESFKIAGPPADSFQTMIYYSVVTFTTLGFGDVTPKTIAAAWWVMAEVVLGYIMLGGLISILANKLARRS